MPLRLPLGRAIARAMMVVLLVSTLPHGLAQAALIGTDQLIAAGQAALPADAAALERRKVEAFVQREDVRAQMIGFGVDPSEASARIASLSDAEIHQIAGQIDKLPAGQGVIVAVVGAAVFIFLVLLITDILGLTDIFPFVRSPSR
ncbi:MAG: PA2779 family protein [Pseudomonadota bacterium]